MKARICAEPDCGTSLSRFNVSRYCWNHQDVIELTGVKWRQAFPPKDRADCSPRFRKGLPGTYAMSEADAGAYRTGAWLGAV